MDTAISICKKHYIESGKRNGCGKCPIINECQSSHEWSQAGIDSWREKCEASAVMALSIK